MKTQFKHGQWHLIDKGKVIASAPSYDAIQALKPSFYANEAGYVEANLTTGYNGSYRDVN